MPAVLREELVGNPCCFIEEQQMVRNSARYIACQRGTLRASAFYRVVRWTVTGANFYEKPSMDLRVILDWW